MISVQNFYFQNYTNNNEQGLLDDLVCEATSIAGMDVYYVARDVNTYDKLYGEDVNSSYTKSWKVAVYLKDIFGYAGDKSIMSKFAGFEIRDQIIVSLPFRFFDDEMQNELGYSRPHEGDLIHFPFNQTTFQIKFVNQNEMFYQLGSLHSYELTCELFEYSNETFNTGIYDIDKLQTYFSTNLLDYALRADDGTPLLTDTGDYLLVDAYNITTIDPNDDSAEVEKEAAVIIDWTPNDPFNDQINRVI